MKQFETGYICNYSNEESITDKICEENNYVILNNYKELLKWDSQFDWNLSKWCRENLEKFPDSLKGIIKDGMFLTNREKDDFRIVTRNDLIKLYFDVKDLRNQLINTIPEFFPKNILELSWFELNYTEIWRDYLKTHFEILESDIPYYQHHCEITVFETYYINNADQNEKIRNLKFGNHTLDECNWNDIEWIFDKYEKLCYILGDSDIEWKNFKFFFMEK